MPPNYFSDVYPVWHEALSEASGRVVILSPYLSSPVAEDLVRCLPKEAQCEIYTLFDIRHFLQNPSSLETIRNLMRIGVSIYELPNLHAKVVIIDKQFASIGSQNVTQGGRGKREATVIYNKPKEVAEILELYDTQWIRERTTITQTMIQNAVGVIEKAKKLSEALDAEIWSLLEEQRKLLKSDKRQRGKTESKQNQHEVENTKMLNPSRSLPINVRVEPDRTGKKHRLTLKAQKHVRLDNWEIDGKAITLLKMHRYVCIISDSWRVAFVRVTTGRITFFHSAVGSDSVDLGGQSFDIQIECSPVDWDTKANVRVKYFGNEHIFLEFEVACRLLPDSFEIVSQRISYGNVNNDGLTDRFDAWIRQNPEDVRHAILKCLLNPFQCKKKLVGIDAGEFLGLSSSPQTIGQKYATRLVQIDQFPMLEIREISEDIRGFDDSLKDDSK